MRKKQLLALMLAGSLVMGMTPSAVFAEEAASFADGASLTAEAAGADILPAAETENIMPAADITVPETTPAEVTAVENTPTEMPAEVTPEAPIQVPSDDSAQAPTDVPTQAPTDVPTQAPTDVPTQAPTDVPTQAPTDVPTQAPTDVPSQAPTDVPTQTPTDAPAAPDFSAPSDDAVLGDNPSGDVNESPEEENLVKFELNNVEYETLEAAISAAAQTGTPGTPSKIIIRADQVEISDTITITENMNVILASGVETVTISRADGFYGELFSVNGGILDLQSGVITSDDMQSSVNTKLHLDGTVEDEANAEISSLIDVNAGVLGIGDGVILENNHSDENGSAIENTGGTVCLAGGKITENTTDGEGGAIYSTGPVSVYGTPYVYGNLDAEAAENNIVLSGENAYVAIVKPLKDGTTLGIQAENAAERENVVVALDQSYDIVTGPALEAMLSYFVYDDEAYELKEDGSVAPVESENPDDPENPDNPENPDDPDDPEYVPVISNVENSLVDGIQDAKYFYPVKEYSGKYTYYDVKVTGAGMNITNPGNGDTRWKPLYWADAEGVSAEGGMELKENSDGSATITLGTETGIEGAGTHTFYVYYGEQIYNAESQSWEDSDVVESVPYQYKSMQLFYLNGSGITWKSPTEVDVTFYTNKQAMYYVTWVPRDNTSSNKPSPTWSDFIDMDVAAGKNLTVTVSNLDVNTAIDVYVYAMDKEGGIYDALKFQPKEETRPSADAPSREPYDDIKASDSVVTGLSEPLEFYPGVFYPFTVTGAGTNNNDPITGDVKWVPMYWSTSQNPSEKYQETTWKIGAQQGVRQAATFKMYVFYKKYIYNGYQWVATDIIDSVQYYFKSAAIDFTVTPTPEGYEGSGDGLNYGGGSGLGYYDESGNYITYDDPEYQEGETSETGAEITAKNAVDTADESPVGSMMAMLLAALMTGVYAFIRRRKNEI